MAKPTPDESTAAAAPASVAAKTIIRAELGKPWPDPPATGTWSRDGKTGDLTLEVPGTQPMTEEARRARRDQQRAAAINTAKE